MSLTEKLLQDMKSAMKNKEKEKLSTIRMVRAAIKKQEIENRSSLNDEQALEVILREIKQRKDAIAEYEKAGRDDLVQREKQQLEILEVYLPKQLSQDELKNLVQETIQHLGVTSKAEFGKVMKAVMPKIKGKADGKMVNQIVQQLLN